VGYRVGSAVIC